MRVCSNIFVSKEKESGRSEEIGVGGRVTWWGKNNQPTKQGRSGEIKGTHEEISIGNVRELFVL